MRFELFVALRHLMSRERRALISVITTISILGVIVGVAALVAVIAVMDGADRVYMRQLIDVYSHIEVYDVSGAGFAQYREIVKEVEKDPEVVAASPILKRFAALKLDSNFSDSGAMVPAMILGVDPDTEGKVSKIGRKEGMVMGKRIPGDGEVVLGNKLSEQLRVAVGDIVFAVNNKIARTANGPIIKQSKLKVAGLFRSGIYEVDNTFAYVSLKTAQNMNVLDDQVDFVHASVKNPYMADAVKKTLSKRLGPGYKVQSWADLSPDFFAALKLEKIGMFIILLLIVIVAALNIISTLILVTMEKTREIGVLRAMGCSRRSIRRIFILEGAIIGVAGTVLGVGLGLIIAYLLPHIPLNMPEAIYGFSGLPVYVNYMTILIIVGSSIAISACGVGYPRRPCGPSQHRGGPAL